MEVTASTALSNFDSTLEVRLNLSQVAQRVKPKALCIFCNVSEKVMAAERLISTSTDFLAKRHGRE
jgi:hypothetical protein